MRTSTAFLFALACLCSLITNAQSTSPNFIIFIADDVSWDDLGCYGNKEVKTPNIDRLAASGILFTSAYLTASSCSPSRNSIMCGRYPHNTGAAELHTEPPLDMVSLPEVLKKGGYYTAQSGKFHMGKYIEKAFDAISRTRPEVGDGGEEYWVKTLQERPKDQPFFMWFAAFDAHRPWGPNEFSGTHDPTQLTPPFYLADAAGTKEDLGKYYDEITRFDHYIGLCVQELEQQGVLDNTLIIVMADNGRPFPHSKTRVNDRGMQTPFVVHWPEKIKEAAVCSSLLSVIDIAPTFVQLAGLNAPESFQGSSFDTLLNDPEATFRNYVFAEHNWHDYEAYERMVRNEDFMYILNARPNQPQLGPADAVGSPSYKDLLSLKAQGTLTAAQADIFATPRPREELYEVRNDPWQLLNVASTPTYQSVRKEMRSVLDKWMSETGDNIPEQLTRDWYLHAPDYIQTSFHNVRGEMPGAATNATRNNQKGPF